jgi:ribonuclease D
MKPLWIDTDAALAEACVRWRGHPWIAVDTEFVRINTYRAQLCLVQVGADDGDACIDTLAITDLKPLWDLLLDEAVLKVLHASSQDIELVVEHTGRAPAPLFDTQIAATLLGLGDQIGYAGLVEQRLGVVVDKSLSRTDWAKRPLRQVEIDYAADDVRHLRALYPALRDAVRDAGRLDWLQADCGRLTDPARYRIEPADAWQRLKGLNRLEPAAQGRAAALAGWRETEAQARNRPRRWILEDAALYRLAERNPDTPDALAALAVLPDKTLARHGSTLLSVLAEAHAQPVRVWAAPELAGETKAHFKALQQRVREVAERLGLPPGYLAPRADLEAIALQGAAADVPALSGWRGEHLRDLLTAA